MREIINKSQAAILAVLETTVDAKHADVMEKTGIPRSAYQTDIADLRERAMVVGTKVGTNAVIRLSITMAGIRALRDHIDYQLKLAKNPTMAVPARINVMADDYPRYEPKPMPPCRNNGNRHIRSLGAFV